METASQIFEEDEEGLLAYHNCALDSQGNCNVSAKEDMNKCSATLSPRLCTVGRDRTVRMWDVAKERLLAMSGLDQNAWEVALSPDGSTVVTGDWAGNVVITQAIVS